MDVSLYQAAAAMNASSRWQEVIADNLAANQVPGFKKQDISFSAVQAGFMARVPTAPVAGQRFLMPLAGASLNFQPGELRPTGINTDLAIEGPGFFEVQMPDGTSGFTRDGEFRVDPQGYLVTKRGLQVLGETGPLRMDTGNSAPIVVSPAGDISQGGAVKGRLKVTEFADNRALTPTGHGAFALSDPNVQAQPARNAQVRQSFLESANTSSMLEMSNLISAMRFYEANQRIVQTEDERTARLIQDAANPV